MPATERCAAWRNSRVGVLGRMVAQGVLPEADTLAVLQGIAAEALPTVDARLVAIEVAAALADAVRVWIVARDRAQFAIRRALVPMLPARLPSWRLLAVAHGVNAAAGLPLLAHEVAQAVRREVARTMEAGRAAGR